MDIIETRKEDVVILELVGRLDTNTSISLEEKLLALIENNENKILFDFSQIDFIASSGLRVLLMIGKKLKSGKGKMALCALQDSVKEVFDIAGFTMLFSFFSSQDEGVAELQ